MLRAAEDVNNGVRTTDTDLTFYGLQNLLNAAANISKALWGQTGRLSAERQPLRDSIGVEDDSPLRQVAMRNNFEHFDERLDRWWKGSANHNMMDRNFFSHAAISGANNLDMFRNFDPKTSDLIFWGQEFNIQALLNEVDRMLPKLREEADKPHRLK